MVIFVTFRLPFPTTVLMHTFQCITSYLGVLITKITFYRGQVVRWVASAERAAR